MKSRTSVFDLRRGWPSSARVLLPALALMAGCGGTAVSGGDATGGAGSAGRNAGSGGAPDGGRAGGSATNGGATNGGATAASCTVGDKSYASGTGSFLGPDGCNRCSCLDGQLSCTLLACEIPPPKLCGGIAGIACGDGEYCQYPLSAQCGAGDQSGECTTKPQGCTEEFTPVCGCDGKQYGNACSAASVGMSVAHAGTCAASPGSCAVTVDGVRYPDGSSNIPAGDGCNTCTCSKGALSCSALPCKAPKRCGGEALNTCTAKEYCAYGPGGVCGFADAESVCKPRPSACSALAQPVCGCDGKTYPNTCSAALAGTGVMSSGACATAG